MVLIIIRVSSCSDICRPEEERLQLLARLFGRIAIATPSLDKFRLDLVFVIHEYAALLQSSQL